MRKLPLVLVLGLLTALGLSACNQQGASGEQDQNAEQAVPKPTDPSDTKAWKAYLVPIVRNNLEGMTASRPYLYFIPAGDSDKQVSARQEQLSNVSTTVARTVLPGNLLAFAGPDSATTADIIIQAFENADPDSFKDVIVLFIGDQADKQRVAEALEPSDATYRFVQM